MPRDGIYDDDYGHDSKGFGLIKEPEALRREDSEQDLIEYSYLVTPRLLHSSIGFETLN